MPSPKLPGLNIDNSRCGVLSPARMDSWDIARSEGQLPTHYRKPHAAHFSTDSRWGSSPAPQRTWSTPYPPRNYSTATFYPNDSVDQPSVGPVRSVPASIRQPFQKRGQLIFTEPLTPTDLESGNDKPQRRISLPEEWQSSQTRSLSPKGTLDIHDHSKTRRFSDDPVRVDRTHSGSPLRTQSYSHSTTRLPRCSHQPVSPHTFSTRPLKLHSPYERSFGNIPNRESHPQGYPQPRIQAGSTSIHSYSALTCWQSDSRAAHTPWTDRIGRSVSPYTPCATDVHYSPRGAYPEPGEFVTKPTGYNDLLHSVASPPTATVAHLSTPNEVQKSRSENFCQPSAGPPLETACKKEKGEPTQARKTPVEPLIRTTPETTSIVNPPKGTSPTSPRGEPLTQPPVTQDTVASATMDLDDSQSSSSGEEEAGPQTSRHSRRRPTANHEERRQRRLLRNRLAAQECRRKKKLYVKSLEEHVDYLTLQLVKSRKELEEASVKLAMHHGHRMRPEQTNRWHSLYQPNTPDFRMLPPPSLP